MLGQRFGIFLWYKHYSFNQLSFLRHVAFVCNLLPNRQKGLLDIQIWL